MAKLRRRGKRDGNFILTSPDEKVTISVQGVKGGFWLNQWEGNKVKSSVYFIACMNSMNDIAIEAIRLWVRKHDFPYVAFRTKPCVVYSILNELYGDDKTPTESDIETYAKDGNVIKPKWRTK